MVPAAFVAGTPGDARLFALLLEQLDVEA